MPESKLLSSEELANFLGIPLQTVRGLTRSRTKLNNPGAVIPHIRLGKRLWYRPESVLAWLESRERQ